jgi:hypothetical protein
MQQDKKDGTAFREGLEMLPQDVPTNRIAVGPAVTGSWDPYDVWLKRVKLPRDRQPQRVVALAEAGVASRSAETGKTETLLLRGAS